MLIDRCKKPYEASNKDLDEIVLKSKNKTWKNPNQSIFIEKAK